MLFIDDVLTKVDADDDDPFVEMRFRTTWRHTIF